MRGARYEISSSGIDQALQGVWSDPYGGIYNVGLIIPQVLPSESNWKNRLLFTLAFARFGAHRRVRLVGARQLLTMAAQLNPGSGTSNYILEKQIETPYWHFPDGSVSWHIMRVPPGMNTQFNTSNGDGLAYRYAQNAALLFEEHPELSSYVSPNAGIPYGVPLAPSLGNFHDIRFPWVNDHAQTALDIEFEGPCDIVFFATVKQTDPDTRMQLVLPGSLPGGTGCIPKEDAFLANFQSATVPPTYWRIGGSLIFEEAAIFPWPRYLEEDEVNPWCIPDSQSGGVSGGSIDPPRGRIPGSGSGSGSSARGSGSSSSGSGNTGGKGANPGSSDKPTGNKR